MNKNKWKIIADKIPGRRPNSICSKYFNYLKNAKIFGASQIPIFKKVNFFLRENIKILTKFKDTNNYF